MREPVTGERIREFMRRLGSAATRSSRIYLTGGATAVLLGWRESTLDIDIKMVPESDALFRAIPVLKEELHVNVELASPPDFIPPLPDWESRSPFITREGSVDWHHFDPYSQALSKIERGHRQDLHDAREMIRRALVEPGLLREYFDRIQPSLIRYPAIDPPSYRKRLEEFLSSIDPG